MANDRSISLAGHDVSTKTLNEVVCNRTSLHSTKLLLFYLFSRLSSFLSFIFFLLYLISFACWLTTRRLARIGQGSSSSSSSRQESPVPTGRGASPGNRARNTPPFSLRTMLLRGVCPWRRAQCVAISGMCARILPAMPATHPSLSVLPFPTSEPLRRICTDLRPVCNLKPVTPRPIGKRRASNSPSVVP